MMRGFGRRWGLWEEESRGDFEGDGVWPIGFDQEGHKVHEGF